MNIKTVREFFKQPDDNACLDFLMKQHHGETLDCPVMKVLRSYWKPVGPLTSNGVAHGT